MRFLIAALTLSEQGSIITSKYDLSDFLDLQEVISERSLNSRVNRLS